MNNMNARTHGMSETAEYRSYKAARTRCTNPKSKDYRYYGAKAIRHLREQHRQNFVGCYAAMRRSFMSVNMSWRTAS
jgi:hypothetical protein